MAKFHDDKTYDSSSRWSYYKTSFVLLQAFRKYLLIVKKHCLTCARSLATYLLTMSERIGALDVESFNMAVFEGALAIIVLLFVVYFIFGWEKNKLLADTAVVVLNQHLESQFACLGADPSRNALVKDGPGDYIYYATGRRYTSGLTAMFHFQNRVDMLARISGLFERTVKDRCTLFLPLMNNFEMEPISFFIVKKKELERLRNAGERAANAVKKVESLAGDVNELGFLGDDFIMLSDHSDVITSMMPLSIRSTALSIAPCLQSIHVTDMGASWEPQSSDVRRLVRLVFDVPSASKVEEYDAILRPVLKIALWLVDACASVKLPSAARNRAMDLRRRTAQEEERARMKIRREEAELRRIEKRKAEDDTIAKLSSDKQAKYDEKKRKREQRARLRVKKM